MNLAKSCCRLFTSIYNLSSYLPSNLIEWKIELSDRESIATPFAPFEEDIHMQNCPAAHSPPFEEDIHPHGGPAIPSSPFKEDIYQQKQEISSSRRKILKLLGRLVLTLSFTISIFAVAKAYLAKNVISKKQKATYNLIQTILVLALGLNFFVSNKTICAMRKHH